MAGGQERILRGRIKSVQATKKITRAMELIAASRIVKAQQRVVAAVPYSDMITEVVRDLSAAGSGSSMPLLAGRSEIRCCAAGLGPRRTELGIPRPVPLVFNCPALPHQTQQRFWADAQVGDNFSRV